MGKRRKRLENWESTLSNLLVEEEFSTFKWGVSDCLLTTLRIAGKLVDIDFIKKFDLKGKYSTPLQSRKFGRDNFNGLENGMSKHFNKTDIKKMIAGDIALVNSSIGGVVGIVANGGQYVACKSYDGMVYYDISKISIGWEL